MFTEQANMGYGVYIDLDRVQGDAADSDDADNEFISIVNTQAPAPPQATMEPFYCVYPWSSLLPITARGSTTVCCSMQGDVGTVLDSGDIDRAWNGETLREIRQSIHGVRFIPSAPIASAATGT